MAKNLFTSFKTKALKSFKVEKLSKPERDAIKKTTEHL